MSILGAAAIMGGTSLLGGMFGSAKSAKSASQDRALQRETLAHQKHMDYHGTAVRMADMKNAGINPLLAGGNPADGSAHATPVGDAGAGAQLGQAIPNAISSALQMKEVELAESKKANIDAETDRTRKLSGKTDLETEVLAIERDFKPKLAEAEIQLKGAQSAKERARAENEIATAIAQEIANIDNIVRGTTKDTSSWQRLFKEIKGEIEAGLTPTQVYEMKMQYIRTRKQTKY